MGFSQKQNNLVNLHADCKRASSEHACGLPHSLKEQNLHWIAFMPNMHPPGDGELTATISDLFSRAITVPGTPTLPVQGQNVSSYAKHSEGFMGTGFTFEEF